ncbi:MAG TPA: GIY-YIG nuclease family protein [Dehalococcoidia bacterium]|nr:GIY-YIG nuclease family protein [Dehalococcoidia bacterium]
MGSTKDMARRIAQHNSGKNKSTKSYRPWQLVYYESFQTLAKARRREREIKSWKSHEYMEKALRINR